MDFSAMLNKLKRDAVEAGTSVGEEKEGEREGGAEDSAERGREKRARHTSTESSDGEERTVDRGVLPRTPVRSIYLVCPHNVQTGGPEAMHQLCDALNQQHSHCVNARMLYVREERRGGDGTGITSVPLSRRLPAYDHYDAPTGTVEMLTDGATGMSGDGATDMLIWPEVWTHLMDSFSRRLRKQVQLCIWWLSVNNNNGRYRDWQRQDVLHLYQSEYARRHLIDHGVPHANILAMTEYIRPSVEEAPSASSRSIDVLYNPNKGIHYTDLIKKRSGNSGIQLTPIGGGSNGTDWISPDEVSVLLRKAKVYIDFGPHPGMDRLPREAALANCLVITNAEGAAGYEEDVPIPTDYKFRRFDEDKVYRRIQSCVNEYDTKLSAFDSYRAWINGQKSRMNECVNALVALIVHSREG